MRSFQPVSDRLRARIAAQCTPDDAEIVIAHLEKFPDCNPENNRHMKGAASRPWLDEHKYLNAGDAAELSLLTITAPSHSDVEAEN